MNIVFMGTPDFAAVSLKKLAASEHNILGVFTQPDKPVGRKRVLTPPDVKVAALELGLPVYQPESVKGEETLNILKDLSPDVIVVVAYGKILPESILNLPEYGCVNVHASLLPRHRGASPIQWSIVCGDKVTGVTTMQMDKGMDTGDILMISQEEINDTDTADILFDRLAVKGADLALETLKGLENGTITPVRQNEAEATYAPIISKGMGEIDFNKTAQEINCLIRGLNPWPVAYTRVKEGKTLKVYGADVCESGEKTAAPGTVVNCNKCLMVACGKGTALKLLDVQLEGRNRMPAEVLLNGYKIAKGDILGD